MRQVFFPVLFSIMSLQTSPSLAYSWANSHASIDANIQLIDLSGGLNIPVLKWTDQTSSIESGFSFREPVSLESSDWTTPLEISVSDFYYAAKGKATLTVLSVDSSAYTDMSDLINTRDVYTGAARSGAFTMSGYGIAHFTLDWELGASANGGFCSGGNCEGYVGLGVGVGDIASSVSFENAQGNINQSVEWMADTGWGICSPDADYCSSDGRGTYTFAISSAGEGAVTGEFYVNIFAGASAHDDHPVSAVPEPAVFAMLSSGLCLVGLLIRRRNYRQRQLDKV